MNIRPGKMAYYRAISSKISDRGDRDGMRRVTD
jgi:hypothetical protein